MEQVLCSLGWKQQPAPAGAWLGAGKCWRPSDHRVEGGEKKSPSSSIFTSEALILLLRFPASLPSQSCPPWLAATDVCGVGHPQGCLSCRSSGWGNWSQEGQRHEILQKPYPGANREPAGSHQSMLNHPAPAMLPRSAEHQPRAKDAEMLPWHQWCKASMGMAPCPSSQPSTVGKLSTCPGGGRCPSSMPWASSHAWLMVDEVSGLISQPDAIFG